MLFSQSRALHAALRQFYAREIGIRYDGETTSSSSSKTDVVATMPTVPTTMYADDKRMAMIFITDHFHRQVFDAFEKNPISALLSLAWTICVTCFHISKKMEETEYLRVWSLFICTVNALCSLAEKSSTSTAANENNDCRLFDIDDLRNTDRNFVELIDRVASMNEEQRKQHVRDQLASDLFIGLLERTPFGTYQIAKSLVGPVGTPRSSNQDREWTVGDKIYTYVLSPLNVSDRERYLALFSRYESSDKLRKQVESKLRKRFSAYHAKYGLHVNPWMFATHEREENGSRAMIWQMQKSALVWIHYHALAALVVVNNDRRLINDFLATVTCMDKFIDCGLCMNHWNTLHKPQWEGLAKRADSVPIFTADQNSCLKQRRTSVDLSLLITHNEVQETIDARLKLTDAAVYAIREDYLNLARSVVLAIVNGDMAPVLASDQQRRDVCRQPNELWSYQLKRLLTMKNVDAKTRGFVKEALLRLEWDRMNCE